MSNTPIDRGSDCTALAKRPRELVRVWGDGSIEHQRAALLRVLRARHARKRLIERLQAKRDELRTGGGLAMLVRGMADAALSSVAMKVGYNFGARERGLPEQPIGVDDLTTVAAALRLHDMADELEEPGEN